MAGRLTRANRRKLENVCQQKIDLDNLSSLDVDELIPDNVETPSTEESTKVTESVSHNKEQDDASLSEQDSSEDEESPSEEESSSEDEDEDLDELLNKAQAALASQTASIQLEKEPEHDALKKLSKMNTGISINKELYLKPVSGRAKLTPDTVVLVNPGEKASKKASIVLTANKDEGKKLSKKERQVEREKTAGKAWFDMPKPEMTDEIKRDLQVLKMRHILDRKRHYKKMGKRADPKYFQIGTIIESPTEFFSARINTKDRKQTIVDELMANDDQKQYYKRKYNEVQERTNSGGKKHWKKLKAQRKALK